MQEQQGDLEQARQIWSKGDYAAAYAIYECLLRNHPDYPVVLREYGRAVFAQFDDLEKAAQLFEQVLKIEENSIVVLLYLGELYSLGYGQGYSTALSAFQRVIELSAHDSNMCVEAYLGIGMLYQVPGLPVSYQEALAAYQKAIELDPSSAEAHRNFAMLLYKGGNLPAALKEFKLAKHFYANTDEAEEYTQKFIRRIEKNEPYAFGGYTRRSVISEWPKGPIV